MQYNDKAIWRVSKMQLHAATAFLSFVRSFIVSRYHKPWISQPEYSFVLLLILCIVLL